jgi:hypothetical protein
MRNSQMDSPPIDWLLEDGNPAVRHRTLAELFSHPNSTREATAARDRIGAVPEVKRQFGRRSEHGLRYYIEPKTRAASGGPPTHPRLIT